MADLRSAAPAEGAARGGIVLEDVSRLRKILLHARSGGPDVAVGRARRDGDTLIVSTAPGQWLHVGETVATTGVDMTHFYAAFRLTGPGADDVLRALCAIDLEAAEAFRAPVAKVPTDVVREPDGWLLLVDRSYAAYLWHALLDAA